MEVFDADRELVLRRALDAGVEKILVPSLNSSSAVRVVALTRDHPQLFGAVGFHPTEIDSLRASDLVELENLAAQPRIVAIGEIGLDYYWIRDDGARARQREALRVQLDLARKANRPVVLHMREEEDADTGGCARDLLSLLGEWVQKLRAGKEALADTPGVLHSFSGTLETARQAVDLGFYVGVTGPITYKNRGSRRHVIAHLPLERLVIETDSPFLAPEPLRGQRNEPAFVTHIADRIAFVQSRTPREVADATTANAARLFAWGEPV
jgi:TatD DNase family protein